MVGLMPRFRNKQNTKPRASRNASTSDAPTVDGVLDRIRKFRAAAKLSKRGLAARAGLSGLAAMDKPDWNPEAANLRKIERVIGDWRPGQPVPAEFAA